MANRIGPKMLAVIEHVADNPGCTKLDAANAAWPQAHGRMSYRYGPVNRAIEAGLIEGRRTGNAYNLTVTQDGRDALDQEVTR